MAGTPHTPAQFSQGNVPDDFHVNELASDKAGSLSPYGPELEFPLPIDVIRYTHPSRADRPNLAGQR